MQDIKQSKSKLPFIIFLFMVLGVVLRVVSVFFQTPSVDMEEVERVYNEDQHYQYFYQDLSTEDQNTYQRIYYAVREHIEKIPLEDTNIENIKKLYVNVLDDHPEFYYVNGQFQYIKERDIIHIIPEYDYSMEQVNSYEQQITEHTKAFLDKASNASEYEKAKMIYEYIVENVEYQENSKIDQNIISSLIEGKSVCAGYARAYQYLANQLGLEATYITGVAQETIQTTNKGEGHAWVMIKMNDDYYYCDPTWGDVIEDGMKHTCYGYFMMNSDDMLACYKPDGQYEETTQDQLNYFKNEKTYMDSYDESVLNRAVQQGKRNQTRVAEIKCGNQRVFNQVKSKLESAYLGYRILSNNGCWKDDSSYSWNEELKLIELYY